MGASCFRGLRSLWGTPSTNDTASRFRRHEKFGQRNPECVGHLDEGEDRDVAARFYLGEPLEGRPQLHGELFLGQLALVTKLSDPPSDVSRDTFGIEGSHPLTLRSPALPINKVPS